MSRLADAVQATVKDWWHGNALRMETGTVVGSPAGGLVAVNYGDGSSIQSPYSSHLTLANGQTVYALVQGQTRFVAFVRHA